MNDLIIWAETNAALAIAAAVVALLLMAAAAAGLWLLVSRVRRADRVEDGLTYLAAGIATAVAGSGMWKFFDHELADIEPWLRAVMFGFIELSVITSAVRARRNLRRAGERIRRAEATSRASNETPSAGIDGRAVWVLTGLSAVLATLEAGSFGEAVLRLSAPLVAAWLWERGMAVERQRITGRARIAWKLTPERLLVRLGLADPTDRDASEVAVHRYLTRVALAANAVRLLPAEVSERKRRRAQRRLHRRMDQAVEYAGLATNPERLDGLMDQLRLLYSTGSLPHVDLGTPWAAYQAAPATTVRLDPQPDPDGPSGGSRPVELHRMPVNGHALHGVAAPAVTPGPTLRDPHAGHDDPVEGHAIDPDPVGEGHDRDPDPGAVLPDGSSGAAYVRVALAALGGDPARVGPADVTGWLESRGISVTHDQVKSALRRERQRAAESAQVIRIQPGVARRDT